MKRLFVLSCSALLLVVVILGSGDKSYHYTVSRAEALPAPEPAPVQVAEPTPIEPEPAAVQPPYEDRPHNLAHVFNAPRLTIDVTVNSGIIEVVKWNLGDNVGGGWDPDLITGPSSPQGLVSREVIYDYESLNTEEICSGSGGATLYLDVEVYFVGSGARYLRVWTIIPKPGEVMYHDHSVQPVVICELIQYSVYTYVGRGFFYEPERLLPTSDVQQMVLNITNKDHAYDVFVVSYHIVPPGRLDVTGVTYEGTYPEMLDRDPSSP